jgi:NADH-quinone oxidoreductase subunit N
MTLAAIGQPLLPGWDQLGPFVTELVLIGAIIATLLGPFFTSRRSNTLAGIIALAGLLAALAALLIVRPVDSGFVFGGMLVSDSVAVLWKAVLLVFAIGIVVMWFSTVGSSLHEGDGPEFFTLILGATLGMCLMASTSNLLMIFMAVELASLPSYVLAGFRKTSRLGSEASLKYVLFGVATSSLMVYGMSMLYGLYGTLQLEEMAAMASQGASLPLILGLGGLVIGIGFKISFVPLHFWCPDVFEGAGMDVAAFLSVASKGAGLVLLMRVLMSLAGGAGFAGSDVLLTLAIILGLLGAVTATVGNLGAFVQDNIKRLLAYSSIAHAGYMLCALSLLAGAGRSEAVAQALLIYITIYLFMNLGAFTVAGLIYRGSGSENINDYAGLGTRNPVLALTMTALLFSLVGLPPFAGFLAKFQVMYILGASGSWWWVLVAVIGVNTIFSLYYYVRVIRVMYLVESDKPALAVNPLGAALCVSCAVMLLVMLVGYNPLLNLTARHSHLHVTPAATVQPPPALAGAAQTQQ